MHDDPPGELVVGLGEPQEREQERVLVAGGRGVDRVDEGAWPLVPGENGFEPVPPAQRPGGGGELVEGHPLGDEASGQGAVDAATNEPYGSRVKPGLTQIGPVEVAVPRDREGAAVQRIVKKRVSQVAAIWQPS